MLIASCKRAVEIGFEKIERAVAHAAYDVCEMEEEEDDEWVDVLSAS